MLTQSEVIEIGGQASKALPSGTTPEIVQSIEMTSNLYLSRQRGIGRTTSLKRSICKHCISISKLTSKPAGGRVLPLKTSPNTTKRYAAL